MAIQDGGIQKANKKSQKAKGKGKEKGKGKDKIYIPKPKNRKPSAKEHPAKNDACHHCKEVDHWKRNCPVYLAELMKNKKHVGTASSLDIFRSKKAETRAIGSDDLVLPNGLVIYLDNCHYAPTITRGVVYFHVCDGINEIDMLNILPNVNSNAGYFVTFTDDYSRYGYIYFLKHKHEVFETFKVFKNKVENQLGKTIKALRSDRGGEYISQEFKDYLKACGIVQQLTPPYTPQHNAVYERRNRTLLDMVRSMMNFTTLPLSFWDYALESVARILNMVPTKKVDKTPYELWYGKVPNFSYLKVWDCEAFVKRDMPDKLQQRSAKCIFIGYPKETIGYYFYFPPKNKIVVVKYVEFFKKNLLSLEVEGFEPPHEEEAPVHRFVRTHRAPERLCLNVEAEEHSLGDLNEPANYKAAMLDSESNKWLDAMNVEMQSMKDNQVWCLVDLPPDCKTVRSKWLFKKKTDMDGTVHTYKGHLVAKEFTQLYRVDYEETFSPVTDIRTIRILIAIVAYVPMQERLNLNKTQGASTPGEVKRMQNVLYASAVGSIMYVERCTRPDVVFAQNIKSCFQQNSREPQWTAVKTILKYLRNTKDMFLVYGGNPEAELRVDFYCDAGFKTHKDDTKSQKQRWKLNT
ncbi:retrovirus-related pol polyprotein from transposon TNT 1-94 [Tanacetum coccineum]